MTPTNAARRLIRLALSDVDGTLLDAHSRLTERTRAAVRSFVDGGGQFGLSTGRMPSGVAAIVAALGVPVHLVCYSGAFVRDARGQVVLSHKIAPQIAGAVLDVAEASGACIAYSYFVDADWLAPDPDAPNIAHETAIVGASPSYGDLRVDLVRGVAPNKIFFNCSTDLAAGARLADALAREVNGVRVVRSTNGVLLEVLPDGVSKATGAHALARHLGIDLHDVAAFGDDVNDVELLEAAGKGVAMGNAPASVRASADEVAPSNSDDGVAAVLERLARGDGR